MKAYFDFERVLCIESEKEEERKELETFMKEGFKRGFYHYAAGSSPGVTIGWISVYPRKKKDKK
jgi:hypothetical protein